MGKKGEKGKSILAIDYGEKRIGLAVAGGSLAEPLAILDVRSRQDALEKIAQICRREKIGQIVIGLPRDPQGKITSLTRNVGDFARGLRGATGCSVVFWDETLTSKEAVAKMVQAGRPRKKRRYLDDVVAALILQEYLEQ